MTTDRLLEDEIERWVELSAPPAPWLEERVIDSLRRDNRRARSRRASNLSSPLTVAIAFLLGMAFVVTLMLGAQTLNKPTEVGPSRETAVVSYRMLVDADVRVVDRSDAIAYCRTRTLCIEETAATRDATLRLGADLSAVSPPESLRVQASQLQAAATRFVAQLNTALESMTGTTSDYIAASDLPDVTELDIAAATIDCWPLHPVIDEHGIGCG